MPWIHEFDYSYHPTAIERARAHRWLARGKARVTHGKYGSVILPSSSKLTALENAAEFWKCDIGELFGTAKVERVPDDAGPVRRPKEFYRSDQTA